MELKQLKALLQDVQEGRVSAGEAFERLKVLPFEDLEFAKVDHHRALRTGLPEVIFAPGKTAEHIVEIARSLQAKGHGVLITRVEPTIAAALQEALPLLQYHPLGRVATIAPKKRRLTSKGQVVVVAAGTADLPVAEEAALTAEFFGNRVQRIHDVGVAGLHRLLAHVDALRRARVLIVVAGMEGALPSVVAGLVDRPVIAVPTSVGYGASFGGLAALLAMLNSCAAGVTVVNIDNGFGAAVAATLINRT
ncbi:MAG: nickel pincer cofactor biosynthesis protein LarB [Candidatus Binatia bacterium]|nr:nickel pincer cofactor biosynthesis protein LarB [Candidatus Binatia bacterium]